MDKKAPVEDRLFNYRYQVYIAPIHLYSEEYLKRFGVPATGDKEIDREYMHTPILVYMTAVDMVVHFSNGVDLTLRDPKDSVEIYEHLTEHLGRWETVLERVKHPIDVPIEDLRKMDEFALKIEPMARSYKAGDLTVNPYHRKLFGKGANTITRFRISKDQPTPPTRSSTDRVTSRSPFLSAAMGGSGAEETRSAVAQDTLQVTSTMFDRISELYKQRQNPWQ